MDIAKKRPENPLGAKPRTRDTFAPSAAFQPPWSVLHPDSIKSARSACAVLNVIDILNNLIFL